MTFDIDLGSDDQLLIRAKRGSTIVFGAEAIELDGDGNLIDYVWNESDRVDITFKLHPEGEAEITLSSAGDSPAITLESGGLEVKITAAQCLSLPSRKLYGDIKVSLESGDVIKQEGRFVLDIANTTTP